MTPRHRKLIDDVTLVRWIQAGILRLPRPGTGRRHRISDAEMRAIAAADSVRRLAGVSPTGFSRSVRGLMVAVAEAARSNPPGTVVELPSKSSHVRHVLVVPEA